MNGILTKWIDLIGPWILNHGIKIGIILLGAYFLNRILHSSITRIVNLAVVPDKNLSQLADEKRKDTLISIFTWTIRIVIILVTTMMVLQETGIPVGPMLAGAGIIGLAVGFGGQYLIRDIISGFFIILENQYRLGDVVNFDGTKGLVENISLRMTTLRDMDGTVHHIPHGEIKRVSNLSKDFARINLDIGIGYGSDLNHVISVVNDIGDLLSADPQWREFIIKPPQFLRVEEFADSSIVIKILGETIPLKKMEITGELRKRIKIRFDEEGIEIPFPQRVIHYIPSAPSA